MHMSDEYSRYVGYFKWRLHQTIQGTICTVEHYLQLSLQVITYARYHFQSLLLRMSNFGSGLDLLLLVSYDRERKLTAACPKLFVSFEIHAELGLTHKVDRYHAVYITTHWSMQLINFQVAAMDDDRFLLRGNTHTT